MDYGTLNQLLSSGQTKKAARLFSESGMSLAELRQNPDIYFSDQMSLENELANLQADQRVAKQLQRYETVSSPEYGQKLYEQELANRKAEADLKRAERELAAPTISKATEAYDLELAKGRAQQRLAEMPGTQQYQEAQKELTKQSEEADKRVRFGEYSANKFNELENAIAGLAGVPVDQLETALNTPQGMKKLSENLDKAAGVWDVRFPAITQGKQNVISAVGQIANVAQTLGLKELRDAGVAPGSVTEREWPKFQADLANIDLSQDPAIIAKEFTRILSKVKSGREVLNKVMSQQQAGATGVAPAAAAAPRGAAVPVRSENEAMQLPPGTRFQLPDGRTGTAR